MQVARCFIPNSLQQSIIFKSKKSPTIWFESRKTPEMGVFESKIRVFPPIDDGVNCVVNVLGFTYASFWLKIVGENAEMVKKN